MTTRRALSWLLFLGVGCVLGYAGWLKFADPDAFLSSVRTFELFPATLASAIVVFVPILEMALGVSLATGVLRGGATLLSSLLLLAFIALVAQSRMRGLAIDCGCFGSRVVESDYEYAWKLGENMALLVALWAAAWLEASSRAFSRKGKNG